MKKDLLMLFAVNGVVLEKLVETHAYLKQIHAQKQKDVHVINTNLHFSQKA